MIPTTNTVTVELTEEQATFLRNILSARMDDIIAKLNLDNVNELHEDLSHTAALMTKTDDAIRRF